MKCHSKIDSTHLYMSIDIQNVFPIDLSLMCYHLHLDFIHFEHNYLFNTKSFIPHD